MGHSCTQAPAPCSGAVSRLPQVNSTLAVHPDLHVQNVTALTSKGLSTQFVLCGKSKYGECRTRSVGCVSVCCCSQPLIQTGKASGGTTFTKNMGWSRDCVLLIESTGSCLWREELDFTSVPTGLVALQVVYYTLHTVSVTQKENQSTHSFYGLCPIDVCLI